MILGVHHIGISVPDLGKAMDFYCGVLGFKEIFGMNINGDDPASDRIIGLDGIVTNMKMLGLGNFQVELWEYHHPAPKTRDPGYPPSDHGLTHLCLRVSNIADEHARLVAAGMRFVGPPVHLGLRAAVYGRDPFGNIIEIYETNDPAG